MRRSVTHTVKLNYKNSKLASVESKVTTYSDINHKTSPPTRKDFGGCLYEFNDNTELVYVKDTRISESENNCANNSTRQTLSNERSLKVGKKPKCLYGMMTSLERVENCCKDNECKTQVQAAIAKSSKSTRPNSSDGDKNSKGIN